MWWFYNCKRDFPLSVWVEECCLAAGCIMRSSERTKCISEFGELWYVKLFPLFFLLCSHLLLFFFFCPPFIHFFFFNHEPPKVQVSAVCKINLLLFFLFLFFPSNQRPAPWQLRATPLPNMHENVMVCLEPVCRARKFKSKDREVPTTGGTFMASLARKLKKLA